MKVLRKLLLNFRVPIVIANTARGAPAERNRFGFGSPRDLGGAKVILISNDQEPQEYNFHLPVFLFRSTRDQ